MPAKTVADYLKDKLTDFYDFKNSVIQNVNRYRTRIEIRNTANIDPLIRRALDSMNLSLSVADLNREQKLQVLGYWIAYNRVTTNLVAKLSFLYFLRNDDSFWDSLNLNFSGTTITQDEFKDQYVKNFSDLAVSWAITKINTASETFGERIGFLSSFNESAVIQKMKETVASALSHLPGGIPSYSEDALNYAAGVEVFGDEAIDKFFQDSVATMLEGIFSLKNVGYDEFTFETLNIPMFFPNNEPVNPLSTINVQDNFVSEAREQVTRRAGEAVVIAKAEKNTDTAQGVIPTFKNTGWIIEWAPQQSAGIVKLPIELIYTDRLPFQNVLSIKDESLTEDYETYMSKIFYLPMSSYHMVLLRDFQIGRNVIVARKVTLGGKYLQQMAEDFPRFTMTITVARFGGLQNRVLNFLNAILYFVGRPNKYPGDMYVYNAFVPEQPSMFRSLYREKAYKKYRVVPMALTQRASADNNTLIDITITGLVLAGYEKG